MLRLGGGFLRVWHYNRPKNAIPMPSHTAIQADFPLQSCNTFGVSARARAYARITEASQLSAVLADPALAAMPRLLLGGGSNILLTGDFDGLVLHLCMQGKAIVGEDADHVLVQAQAGENWHGLVRWTVEQGLGGLENLSLIPGTVGAAPIQNIGAYGAEINDVFHSLRVLDMATGQVHVLDRNACRFGYRDSIFKHADGAGLAIVEVTFALPKDWQPNTRYAELDKALSDARHAAGRPADMDLTPRAISDAVIAIRQAKLPDPAVIGNAGSFFKNPVVPGAQCAALLQRFPALVHHAQPDGSEKLAAGWLIDQCGWKGRSMGAAGVYEKQALVLVNRGGATGADIVALAQAIQADVLARYGVQLVPEPVFI
jgi:UDP-N-acetylmuramate dehydrogenase